MTEKPYPRVETLIVNQITRGKGTEDDPSRLITQVHDFDGKLIAESPDFIALDRLQLKIDILDEKINRRLQ